MNDHIDEDDFCNDCIPRPQWMPCHFSYSERFHNLADGNDHGETRTCRSFDESKLSPRILGSSSSDDDSFSYSSLISPAPRPDHSDGLHFTSPFLRRLQSDSDSSDNAQADCEFIGSGGGQGIFKLPTRAAVHPGRPPSLDLRPHPLRETQVGSFIRTIAASDRQLWAGMESGMRYWNFEDMYRPREGTVPRIDEDTAPFHESEGRTSAALCLIADSANRLIWSGHKDGRIRSWKMEHISSATHGSVFKEGLTWHAHRSPVLSIVMTTYGDMWSGFEGGVIKAWPWESLKKSLSLTMKERHIATLLVERSYIDLRNQVTAGGACSLPAVDVRYLISDNSRSKVWSGGYLSFALWDALSKDLLKVLSMDVQIDNRIEVLLSTDFSLEEDMKTKLVPTSRKDKPQGSGSLFQRSRNALIGAADVVRRVAVKGASGDDNRRTEAVIISVDGIIWTGCANGLIVQWDGTGNRLQEFHHHSSSVQCFCTFGTRLWVGYISGTVQVLDLDGNLLGGWIAHSSPVIKMAVGGGFVFTLANHGGIRGWCMMSPSPLDNILRSELSSKELLYTKIENLKILVGTWNVGQERASPDSLVSWLGCSASKVDIVVIGLQEVEMGAGFLAMQAAKETVGLEGSANGQWWLEAIGKTLDQGTSFEHVGSRQLAGLLVSIWARKNLRTFIGDVDAAAVPCGFGRAIGNKGAVGLRMRIYDRIICFVNCHFAAHLDAVNRRNSDFDHVYRTMIFSRPSNIINSMPAGASSAVHTLRGANAVGVRYDEGKPELTEADMVVFLGDFNYRLNDISYDEARDFISQRCFEWLKERDQLRAEMRAGKVFQGMREGHIKFPPTYKFERHQAGLAGYDSSEKRRIPAWCDRILYRDSRSSSDKECSLNCPVVSSVSEYDACMDVTDSDHKPVRCIFTVDIAHVDESRRRQEFGEIMESNEKFRLFFKEICNIPETIISTNTIILQNENSSILRITNKCGKNKAIFKIICEGESIIRDRSASKKHQIRGSFGFPHWLEVCPTSGIINPGQTVEVTVLHEEFHTREDFVDGVQQNSWCEDTRDKEVLLAVKIGGCFSTHVRTHRVRVRHCFSKAARHDLKTTSGGGQQRLLHRADFPHLGSSADVINDLSKLHLIYEEGL